MASESENQIQIPSPSPSLSQPQPLQDRVAIVTGSARGIGQAIALHLGSLGAKLVINHTSSKSTHEAELVASQINNSLSSSLNNNNTPRAITVRADVSDPTQVKSLFDKAEEAFNSPVHILVNSAGINDSRYPTIANTSLEDFDNIFRYSFQLLFFFFFFEKYLFFLLVVLRIVFLN